MKAKLATIGLVLATAVPFAVITNRAASAPKPVCTPYVVEHMSVNDDWNLLRALSGRIPNNQTYSKTHIVSKADGKIGFESFAFAKSGF